MRRHTCTHGYACVCVFAMRRQCHVPKAILSWQWKFPLCVPPLVPLHHSSIEIDVTVYTQCTKRTDKPHQHADVCHSRFIFEKRAHLISLHLISLISSHLYMVHDRTFLLEYFSAWSIHLHHVEHITFNIYILLHTYMHIYIIHT